MNHISVCICTYRRNQMLERLLRKLALQETRGAFEMSVVVVDNDAAGPARKVVEQLGETLRLEITYGIEPVRTIPAARNRALSLARGNYIGIIDDDEFPPGDWLVTMYNAVQTFDVDGALGPVRPYFVQPPPSWLLRGQFSGAPAIRTGTILRWQQTYTGNVLLKKAVFERHNLRFDENYRTGGSDQAFFKEAMNAGCQFVAVEEATVYEIVPPERQTKSYYIKRSFVNGFNAHKASMQKEWSLARITTPLKSAVALAVYVPALPIFAMMGSHTLMSYLEKSGHHLSRLMAMIGIELVKKRDF